MSNNNDCQTDESGEPPPEVKYVLQDLLALSKNSVLERYVCQYHIENVDQLLDKPCTELFDSPVTLKDDSTTYSDWIQVNTIEALQHVKAFRDHRIGAEQLIHDWAKISQSDLDHFTPSTPITLNVILATETDPSRTTPLQAATREVLDRYDLGPFGPNTEHVHVVSPDTASNPDIPVDDESVRDDTFSRAGSPVTVMADLEDEDDEPPPLLDPLTGRLIYSDDDEAMYPQAHQTDHDANIPDKRGAARTQGTLIDHGANGSVFAPTVPFDNITTDSIPSTNNSMVYYCDDVIYYAPGARERVPTSYEEAMDFDTQNGDTAWEDAMLDELELLVGTFTSLPGQRVFRDFMNGELRFHFYIKWNGIRCAQLLDGQPDRPSQGMTNDDNTDEQPNDVHDDPPIVPYNGETPTSFDHALLIDSKSGNHFWRDAILHELHEQASPEASIGYLQGHYDLSFSVTKDSRCLATLVPNGSLPTFPAPDSSASSLIRQLPSASSDGESFDEPVLNTTERSAWDTPPRTKERNAKPIREDTELIIQTGSKDTVPYVHIDSLDKNGEPNHRKFMTL